MTATTTRDPWDEATAPPSEGSTGSPEGAAPADSPTPDPETEKEPTKGPEEGKTGEAPAEAPTAKKAAATPPVKKAATTRPRPAPPSATPVKQTALGTVLADMTTFVTELVWGPEGTGKTTDALRMTKLCVGDDANKRVILINAEGGAKVQALRQRGVDVAKVEVYPREEDGIGALSFEGLFDLATELSERSDEYIGWVWDSGTEITKRLLDTVTAEAREKDAKLGKARGRFQVNLEDHGVASSMLRELLRKYRDLPMHGVITALERRDQDNDTGKVKYGPAMAPAMANDSAGLVDLVIYKTVDNLGDLVIRSGHTVPTKTRRAKDRFGVLPAKLADPYFDRIVGYVNGELTRENDPVQAAVRKHAEELVAAAAADKK